jgi:hypothetical protein
VSEVLLTRNGDGKITGLTEPDARAWARCRRMLESLVPGECVRLAFWIPRSPQFHRRHFALLGAVFEQQEQFADREQFRMWVQVGAGHCDFVPGPKGRMVALPKSIAWHKLEDTEFAAHHAAVVEFLRSAHCIGFLWPQLNQAERQQTIEAVLMEFEQ